MTDIFLLLAAAAAPYAWKDLGDGRLALQERGRTAFVYNYGPQLANGAPGDRRRCCYVHPVNTPSGVTVTDDFPRDHWHHHGLFWAWPVVETGGQTYDLWMYKGVNHRFEKILDRGASANEAWLKVRNGWYTDAGRIVEETVEIRAAASRGGKRTMHVTLSLTADGRPVTLRGSTEKGKSYGGLSARFAPRKNTVLQADGKPIAQDEDLVFHRSGELEALFGGKRAALRIAVAGEGRPHQWCLRDYGFVGASFPGRTDSVAGYTLEPGKPLILRYVVTVADVLLR